MTRRRDKTRLYEVLRAALWFWPIGDRSADWSIVRRLIIIVSVAVGLAGSAWVLVSELQKLRFDRDILAATTETSSKGIGMNIAVMDYASAAFLAEAYLEFSHVLNLQITDRYGFLIFGPQTINMADYPSNAVLVERKLYDDKPSQPTTEEVVGLLRQVVAQPTITSILLGVIWKGLAVGLVFGSIVAVTMRFYMRAFVIEPLERFTEAVATTSQTGKHTRIEYLSETRFGIFARNFNQMQDRLEGQDRTQQSLIELNGRINDDLRRAYDRIREEQRVKLAQFEALGRVLDEAEIVLTYVDRKGQQVFSNAGQHPVGAIVDVLQQSQYDSDNIISRFSAAGLTCHLVSHPRVAGIGRHSSFEIEVSAPDGRTWVLVAGPRDTDGQVILCTNISNLREMEQQLRQKQKMEALGRLVGGVAHEFNNMLSIIAGNLELLEIGGGAEGPARQESLAAAQRASDRAAATVSQLLTFARRKTLDRKRIEIDTHFAGLTSMLRGVLGPRITLDTRIEPGIVIDCDPGQLDGAIVNLATNARDAMNGSGVLHLRIFRRRETEMQGGVRRQQDFCVIEMEDTGPGVPPEIRHKVFEPFFSTKADSGKGVGLGLAAVSGFAAAFGGSAEIRSGAAGGALFVLKLPAGGKVQRVAPRHNSRIFSAAGMRCLVLEDEAELQRIAVLFLERFGFVCDTTCSLKEASEVLSRRGRGSYRLLLCDLQLPDGNGADFLPAFREANPDAGIICASGNAVTTQAENEMGAVFLAKPYSFADLNKTVFHLLGEAA